MKNFCIYCGKMLTSEEIEAFEDCCKGCHDGLIEMEKHPDEGGVR